MTLTDKQRSARAGKLTASGIGVLMRGDPLPIRDLWRELIGDPTWVPVNLLKVWAVQLGAATEKLHLDWLAGKYDENISRRGEFVIHPLYDWAGCTLDGWLDHVPCPIEVKHVGGFESRDIVVNRYYPQMTWQMIITGTDRCVFSVIEGAREPVQETIHYDEHYAGELLERAKAFMAHVQNLTEPVELEAIAPPLAATIEYDYSTNNLFVSLAQEWLQTRFEAKRNEVAKKRIKELIPGDAMRVFGGGIEVTRDRANRVQITEEKHAERSNQRTGHRTRQGAGSDQKSD